MSIFLSFILVFFDGAAARECSKFSPYRYPFGMPYNCGLQYHQDTDTFTLSSSGSMNCDSYCERSLDDLKTYTTNNPAPECQSVSKKLYDQAMVLYTGYCLAPSSTTTSTAPPATTSTVADPKAKSTTSSPILTTVKECSKFSSYRYPFGMPYNCGLQYHQDTDTFTLSTSGVMTCDDYCQKSLDDLKTYTTNNPAPECQSVSKKLYDQAMVLYTGYCLNRPSTTSTTPPATTSTVADPKAKSTTSSPILTTVQSSNAPAACFLAVLLLLIY